MGWWTDPVGSKRGGKSGNAKSSKAKSTPERGKVVATTKPGKAEPVKRCEICRKTTRCTCRQVGDAIPTRRGTPKDRVDDNGVIWCGACQSRTHKGVCMNVMCKTRVGS